VLEAKSGLIASIRAAANLQGLAQLTKGSRLRSLGLDEGDSKLYELVTDLRWGHFGSRLVKPLRLLLKDLLLATNPSHSQIGGTASKAPGRPCRRQGRPPRGKHRSSACISAKKIMIAYQGWGYILGNICSLPSYLPPLRINGRTLASSDLAILALKGHWVSR
jgi:hypothetical protein